VKSKLGTMQLRRKSFGGLKKSTKSTGPCHLDSPKSEGGRKGKSQTLRAEGGKNPLKMEATKLGTNERRKRSRGGGKKESQGV